MYNQKFAIDHSFVQYTIICHNPQLEEESLSTPKPNLKGEIFWLMVVKFFVLGLGLGEKSNLLHTLLFSQMGIFRLN